MSVEPAIRLPVANERGERLLRIHAVESGDEVTTGIDFALVAAFHDGRVLLVHHRRRGVWELPGGFVDPGETAEACALREFAEETGQPRPRLYWRAVLELEVPDDGRVGPSIRHGALLSAEFDALVAFKPNAETDAIGLWPAAAPPPGTSAVDAALLQGLAPLILRRPKEVPVGERGRG